MTKSLSPIRKVQKHMKCESRWNHPFATLESSGHAQIMFQRAHHNDTELTHDREHLKSGNIEKSIH